MKLNFVRVLTVAAAVVFMSATVMETTAHARAGGGRSMGSRGSRSYAPQRAPIAQPQAAPYRQQMGTPSPMQQQGGSFLRSMAGGIAGGLLGGMLFRGIAGAGGAGFGGGIGLFDILLLAGIGYLIYRMVAKRRRETTPLTSVPGGYGSQAGGYQSQEYQAPAYTAPYQAEPESAAATVATGLSYVRQMDHSFDEARFKDLVMDNFFKIQGGWMNRDLSALSPLLTDDMKGVFGEDIDRLLRDRQVNRLENIAVRNVDIAEVWQEAGQDYITVLIYANLLDYTTDESGQVLAGSKTEPVKFEEYWTFTRPVGNNPWRLGAIEQKK